VGDQNSDVRLVVADIDGTLVTRDKRVTPAALEAIRKLREAGIRFTVTSARPPRGLQVIADVVTLTEPVPALNGGLLVKPDLRSILRKKLLERVVVERLLSALCEAGLDVWVYTDNEWLVRDGNGPYVHHEVHAVKFSPRVIKSLEEIPLKRVVKVVGVSEDFAAVAEAEKKLQAEFAGAVSATLSQKYYLDVTHPDANKGEGILLLSELLDIPTEQIAVIGDMQNDVPMFRQSGLSIAMGNASSDVQREAKYVTTSNEEEGFANAVARYILAPREQAAIG
jgi:Cof subfamily protein (haloacid dehalogenase superfamily)